MTNRPFLHLRQESTVPVIDVDPDSMLKRQWAWPWSIQITEDPAVMYMAIEHGQPDVLICSLSAVRTALAQLAQWKRASPPDMIDERLLEVLTILLDDPDSIEGSSALAGITPLVDSVLFGEYCTQYALMWHENAVEDCLGHLEALDPKSAERALSRCLWTLGDFALAVRFGGWFRSDWHIEALSQLPEVGDQLAEFFEDHLLRRSAQPATAASVRRTLMRCHNLVFDIQMLVSRTASRPSFLRPLTE